MFQKSEQTVNDALRRNVWRSLLIMRKATVSELLGVVRELSTRKARALLRELETHGYAGRTLRKGRPEYFQAVDSPSLPTLCAHCNRPFSSKACSKKETKRDRQKERERQLTMVPTTTPKSPAAAAVETTVPNVSLEVNHDAA
ncbi:hypothetical protein GMLC_14950 [Geomonas limicola]|uniref:Uncharacterized protein n=1 Tax=Geomonas limicola TaxID=2740186 RepID=A0A6V8N5U6_9BACT|nr:hypothetical protein GMLC_14950 [Geomonas limicola]